MSVSRVRRAGKPAQPPDHGGQDQDRQPDPGVVLEYDGPDGRERDGGAGPGQFGAFAGQPGIGLLDVGGWRFARLRVQGALTADSRASAAASRPMTVIAIARIWGRRERGSGSPWRSARWLAFHST